MVSEKDWNLTLLPDDAVRRQRLLHPPSAEDICKSVITEAVQAARQGQIVLDWKKACDKPGYFRVRAQFPVSETTYDILFNGRSGYRAQYYLSPEEGIIYNRQIIDGLLSPIRIAYDRKPHETSFDLIERSLRTPHAKIWVYETPGRDPFYDAGPTTLNAPRWIKNNASRGRYCPLPLDLLMIDLKGAFIDPHSADFFVGDDKENRACDLYSKGCA